MIRCLACDGLLRMRVTGAWVHVDAQGNALASESIWPRDHAPRPFTSSTATMRAEIDRDTFAGALWSDNSDVQIRWGDGLAFDRAAWERMWGRTR